MRKPSEDRPFPECAVVLIPPANQGPVRREVVSLSKHTVRAAGQDFCPVRQLLFTDDKRARRRDLLLCETCDEAAELHRLSIHGGYVVSVRLPCVMMQFGAGVMVPLTSNKEESEEESSDESGLSSSVESEVELAGEDDSVISASSPESPSSAAGSSPPSRAAVPEEDALEDDALDEEEQNDDASDISEFSHMSEVTAIGEGGYDF